MSMKNTIALRMLVLSTWMLTLIGSTVHAARDGGQAGVVPWSGYWWPHKSGGLIGPLSKYDKVTGQQAAGWEDANHVSVSPPPQDWFGHCHAWSASSVSEKEPRESRTVDQVGFGVGDLKGLLAACHAQDVANSYGSRYNAGDDEAARMDIAPDELWRLLQTYVKQKKIPLVLDLEAGEQVWNYPVYQYRVDFETSADGWAHATLQLVVAEDDVPEDYIGTKNAKHTYTFRVKMVDGAIDMGTGQWTGESVKDHPDFAWYPYVAVAENPYVDAEQVSRIVGYAVGGANSPPEDSDSAQPPELPAGPAEPTPTEPDVLAPTEAEEAVTEDPPIVDNVEEPVTPASQPPEEAGDSPTEAPPTQNLDQLLSPDELAALVVNKTSAFFLDVQIDRGDGGTYRPGERMQISIAMRDTQNKGIREGYVYLFDIDPAGDLQLIYPPPGISNRIEVDTVYRIPLVNKTSWLKAQGPGVHDLKAIVTSQPVQLTGFEEVPSSQRQQQQTVAVVSGGQAKPKPNQVKPRATQQVSGSPQTAERRGFVRRLTVHPQSRLRQQRRFRLFRKDLQGELAAPESVGPFAQDMCTYHVLPSAGGYGTETDSK